MQSTRAWTSGLAVQLLLLAPQICSVAPVLLTPGVWFVVPCAAATLCVYACAVSGAPCSSFTGVRVPCVLCALYVACWRLFIAVRVVCGTHVVLVASLPTLFFFLGCLFDENRGGPKEKRPELEGDPERGR